MITTFLSRESEKSRKTLIVWLPTRKKKRKKSLRLKKSKKKRRKKKRRRTWSNKLRKF